MSILDDAREGMDTDIRPQDDLFGHVNGRWLVETEIPADRSSWGPFVQLADICEQQVRDIITELADGFADGTADASTDAADLENARKIADLYNSFMDTERIATLGLDPVRALLEAASGLRDVRDLAAFLGEFERVGGYGVFGSYVDTDDRNSDRYLLHVVQGGLGLPDESYYRDDKFAEIREAYVAYLGKLLTLGEHADPEGAAQRILALDTELAKGHWERADTRDVQKTYNLRTGDELRAMCPAFDWDAYVTNLGGHSGRRARDDRGAVRAPAVVPRAPLDRPHRDADRDLAGVDVQPGAAVRGAVPPRRVRRDQLRLLRPHPLRHARAACPLEARRCRSSREPSARPSARSTSPGTSRPSRRR